jgi:hypothetical protein
VHLIRHVWEQAEEVIQYDFQPGDATCQPNEHANHYVHKGFKRVKVGDEGLNTTTNQYHQLLWNLVDRLVIHRDVSLNRERVRQKCVRCYGGSSKKYKKMQCKDPKCHCNEMKKMVRMHARQDTPAACPHAIDMNGKNIYAPVHKWKPEELDHATDWYTSCNTKGILIPYSSDESDSGSDDDQN